jgi:hypothetical protein
MPGARLATPGAWLATPGTWLATPGARPVESNSALRDSLVTIS